MAKNRDGTAIYTLNLFKSWPGMTLRLGDGSRSFEAASDDAAIRHVVTRFEEDLARSDGVELWSDGRMIWERPRRPERPETVYGGSDRDKA